MKKITTVYPFDSDFIPFLRNNAFPQELDIKYLVSPSGWGYDGQDAGCADCGPSIGSLCSSDFSQACELSDTIVFAKSLKPLNFDEFIWPKMQQAVEARKNIVATLPLSQEYLDKIKHLCKEHECGFQYFYDNLSQDSIVLNPDTRKQLEFSMEILTPVIMVTSITDDLCKFDTQLGLASYAQKAGYKVSLITSRQDGSFAGYHSYPNFMLHQSFSEKDKILLFNHFVKNIEQSENPDVIIIGIPGGVFPLKKNQLGWCGTSAFEISHSLQSDVAVVCLYVAPFNETYYDELNKVLEYRFALTDNHFLITNVSYDDFTLEDLDRRSLIPVSYDKFDKYDYRSDVYPVYTMREREALFESVIKTLQGNMETASL